MDASHWHDTTAGVRHFSHAVPAIPVAGMPTSRLESANAAAAGCGGNSSTTLLPPSLPAPVIVCTTCHAGKRACDGHTPCERCIRIGKQDTCKPRVPLRTVRLRARPTRGAADAMKRPLQPPNTSASAVAAIPCQPVPAIATVVHATVAQVAEIHPPDDRHDANLDDRHVGAPDATFNTPHEWTASTLATPPPPPPADAPQGDWHGHEPCAVPTEPPLGVLDLSHPQPQWWPVGGSPADSASSFLQVDDGICDSLGPPSMTRFHSEQWLSDESSTPSASALQSYEAPAAEVWSGTNSSWTAADSFISPTPSSRVLPDADQEVSIVHSPAMPHTDMVPPDTTTSITSSSFHQSAQSAPTPPPSATPATLVPSQRYQQLINPLNSLSAVTLSPYTSHADIYSFDVYRFEFFNQSRLLCLPQRLAHQLRQGRLSSASAQLLLANFSTLLDTQELRHLAEQVGVPYIYAHFGQPNQRRTRRVEEAFDRIGQHTSVAERSRRGRADTCALPQLHPLRLVESVSDSPSVAVLDDEPDDPNSTVATLMISYIHLVPKSTKATVEVAPPQDAERTFASSPNPVTDERRTLERASDTRDQSSIVASSSSSSSLPSLESCSHRYRSFPSFSSAGVVPAAPHELTYAFTSAPVCSVEQLHDSSCAEFDPSPGGAVSRTVASRCSCPLVLHRRSGVYVNAAFERLTGYTQDEIATACATTSYRHVVSTLQTSTIGNMIQIGIAQTLSTIVDDNRSSDYFVHIRNRFSPTQLTPAALRVRYHVSPSGDVEGITYEWSPVR